MAQRKIIWTKTANEERKAILEYWINRNSSKQFSKRLNKMIIEALQIIALYPETGRKTNDGNTRVKVIRMSNSILNKIVFFYERNCRTNK
jgi:hypothetical protein